MENIYEDFKDICDHVLGWLDSDDADEQAQAICLLDDIVEGQPEETYRSMVLQHAHVLSKRTLYLAKRCHSAHKRAMSAGSHDGFSYLPRRYSLALG
jgi:hypothetical protein